MTLALLAISIVILLLLRVPVAFAFLGPSLVYMLVQDQSSGMSLRQVTESIQSFPLLAVPLFILLGTLANHSGIADRLFDFALALFAPVRGSLGYVSVGTSVGFSWMSGSAVADAAALGKVQIPAMLRNGYSRRFATGISSTSALISPVMPPSIPAVIFAGLAAASTGALFAASVVPAILIALGLCIAVWVMLKREPHVTRGTFNFEEFRRTIKGVLLPVLTPVIVLGGILGGFFTPTEAAGIAVAYVLIIALVERSLTWKGFFLSLQETVLTTGAIMLIVAAAALLGYILAVERLPQMLTELMLGITDNPTVFLLLVMILMLILGTVIDATAVLVLVVPVLLPIATQYGIDPIHLGVVLILSLMIGLLTPPVGTVLFVTAAVSDTKVGEVFKGALPFLIPMLVVTILTIFFPDVLLFFPHALGL